MNIAKFAFILAATTAAAACGDSPSAPRAGTQVQLELAGLRPLDAQTEGSYQAWVYDAAGTPHSLGRFALPGSGSIPLEMPVSDGRRIAVTVEPPGDSDSAPAAFELLSGNLKGSSANLSINGSVTAGPPLNPDPGHHSLFTSSNNVKLGYPSDENAGIWMFSIQPSLNKHGSREVMVTPLRRAWLYEGWVVHRYGTPDAVWVSYGKFRPDQLQLLNSRDDTGSGPFSGDEDYRNGGVEDVPGEEWTVNPLGLAVPGGLELPFQLDAVDAATGEAVWTHVITIEPAFDEDEPLLSEQPFLLQPYRNAIGAGRPWDPRKILLQNNLPTGTLRITG